MEFNAPVILRQIILKSPRIKRVISWVIQADEQPSSRGRPPGVRQKPIWRDKETKRRVVLVRFEPGAKLPVHRHVGDELIFVIEGSNADKSGEVMTGDMNFRPDGCVHTVTTRNGATVLALVTGGVEMLG